MRTSYAYKIPFQTAMSDAQTREEILYKNNKITNTSSGRNTLISGECGSSVAESTHLVDCPPFLYKTETKEQI